MHRLGIVSQSFLREPFRVVAARLLKSLGNPPPHSVKYFAASKLLEQMEDRTWLAKVTNALNQHWQKRNAAKQNCPANGSSNGHNRPEADARLAPASA